MTKAKELRDMSDEQLELTLKDAVDMVNKVAANDMSQMCFASHWLEFAYGRTLGMGDECAAASVQQRQAKAAATA